MILSALFLSAFAHVQATLPQSGAEVYNLVRVELGADPAQMVELSSLGLDLSHAHFGAAQDGGNGFRTVELVVDEQELIELRRKGFAAELLIHDMSAYYAQRLTQNLAVMGAPNYGAWLNPPFAAGAMSGYYNFTQVAGVLDQVHAAYPNITTAKSSIGQTLQGRDLWMLKVSDNPDSDENEPEVRFDALHHAREPQGMQVTFWFMLWLLEEYGTDPLATYLVNEREMYFVPCVNADGYVYNEQIAPQGGGMWRKNRRNNGGGSIGVDLNRNYPFQWGFDNQGSSSDPDSDVFRGASAASEPAVQAMVSFISSRNFASVLTLHTYSNLWLAPLGYIASAPANGAQYDEIGALATEINGDPFGPASTVLYLANGTTLDYDHGVHSSLAWTPEIGSSDDGFWPVQARIIPLAEENRIALARTALAAGVYLNAIDVSQVEALGDGDTDFEGGETVAIHLDVRNSGRLASTLVEAQLSSSSAQLEVIVGSEFLGAAASFGTVSTVNGLRLRVLPGTPVGTYPYELRIVAGTWQESLAGEITVGSNVNVASFDFEAAGAEGWSVGSPNDASTGTWTRVDPRGTQAQPENDHTSGGGNTLCWVTGQGSVGGSDGENDVDGGTTTLISPSFDLSGALDARIRYWRWYSNSAGAAPNADVFEVDLSNDDGANWFAAEVVGPAGPGTSGNWIEAQLDVDELLPLTNQMRLRFRASDLGSGSIVEAAIDDVTITLLTDGNCPAPEIYCQTTPNTVSAGALVATSGSTGVADGTFTLHVSDAVPNNFGLFFYGSNQSVSPLGEGSLCIAPPHTRLNVLQTDASGSASQLLLFTGQLTANSAWNFQFWYRDPTGGPSGFNLSNAVHVMFCD